ncbi:MAG: DUF4382 domain-containing protein [Candidatus Levyibacteriota bacterium]
MAKKTNKNQLLNKKNVYIAVALFALGLPIAIVASQQTTVTQQHASQFNDLNTSTAITQTNNTDGTMGSVDSRGNFSNTFPDVYLGNLSFLVTDPPQAPHYSGNGNTFGLSHNPTLTLTPAPTIVLPTQAQGQINQGHDSNASTSPVHGQNTYVTDSANGHNGGPQAVTSLQVIVTKVEVHLAHIGLPGAKNQAYASPTPEKHYGKPVRTSNQEVDKWETLQIGAPQSLDLVQLANAHLSTLLCNTKLVNGRYTEIRLYISKASATLKDGTKVDVVIPGKGNIVRVVHPFVIDSSKTTSITMDFDAQNSVIQAGTKYILKPVIAKMVEKDVN